MDPLFAEGTLPSLMLAAGIGLLIVILLRRSSRKLGKKKRGKQPTVSSALTTPPIFSEAARGQMYSDRQQIELHELGRELMGRLDSKMILLQELVHQSQQQIDRLEQLLDAADEKYPRANRD